MWMKPIKEELYIFSWLKPTAIREIKIGIYI